MVRLYHTDCMEYMKDCKDNQFDLTIVDPPYGIYEDSNRDLMPKGAATVRKKYNNTLWGQEKPDYEYFNELIRISKNQIIWGGNYFTDYLKPSRCWVVWDKRVTCASNSFADCELAWTNFNTSVRKFAFLWNGMLQGDMKNKEIRIHPTQKPVKLYRWLLENYAKEGDTILDTHLGSFSSAIAAYDMGFDFVGCEIDRDYFEAGLKRFNQFKTQTKMFRNEKCSILQ